MGMTIDDFETKALQVLLSQRFIDLPLFEEEELSNYEVADIQGSMPFDDFIRQYAEIIMEQVKVTYENRLKADLKAILVELQLEIEEKSYYDTTIVGNYEDEIRINLVELDDVNEIIQQKINELKGEGKQT